jgi:hypothetical protein
MLDGKQRAKINYLYERALHNFIAFSNFNPREWLYGSDILEYDELVNIDDNEGRN